MKFLIIGILIIVVLLVCSYFYMLKCRKRIFERASSIELSEIESLSAVFRKYLEQNKKEVKIESLEELTSVVEESIMSTFEYQKIDPNDTDLIVLAAGSYIGEYLRKKNRGEWRESRDGPELLFRENEIESSSHPVLQVAKFREHGQPGDLIVYVTTGSVLTQLTART